MKNKIYIMVLYLYIILLMPLISCNTWQNHRGASDDIEESKKRGVFIVEYQAIPNPIRINDTLIFDIEHAWLERHWKYPENRNETDVVDGYQLIIETKNDIHRGFDETWTIGIDFDRYIRTCGDNCLITDFDTLPVSNKEVWQVQAGWELHPEVEKIVLGEFILYKKMNR